MPSISHLTLTRRIRCLQGSGFTAGSVRFSTGLPKFQACSIRLNKGYSANST
ncbi:hypothetical protein [Paenibacillus filicis]|uniref:hypothetical protein n=1 Tax=Paenibacillus filicis TaxID=669464 RepID=UPI003119BC18